MKKGLTFIVLLVIGISVSAYVLKGDKEVDGKSISKDKEILAQPIKKEIIEPEVAKELTIGEKTGNYPQDYFRNPIDGEIYLSGTFAELRSNHFHAGIDIRTGGVEGKKVYAVADGYISRVNVSTYGYGKAVYIRHPNGYTSVYGHLQQFKGELKEYVEKAQYRNKSFKVQQFPAKDLIKVKKGDVIALSGNTGGSGGPHLHFEIRSTATEATINPLLFGLDIKDQRSPKVKEVYIRQVDATYKKVMGYYPFRVFEKKEMLNGKTVFVQGGTYAIAAVLKDQFLNPTENLGLNYMKLFVDGTEVYSTKIEKFYFHETRYMNCHMEFSTHKNSNKKATKFYLDEGNKLPFYEHKNKGFIKVVEGGNPVKVRVEIEDLSGKTDKIEFFLKGVEGEQSLAKQSDITNSDGGILCSPAKGASIKEDDYSCLIPSGSLYSPYLFVGKSIAIGTYSNQITFGSSAVPLHKKMTCKIRTKNLPKGKENKIYVVELFKGKKYSNSCIYLNGYAKFATKDFGTYYVDMDTIKPQIRAVNVNPVKEFRFYVTDKNKSGIKSYNGYVDGKWFLLDWESKTGILKGTPRIKLTKGKHTLKVVVTDVCNNKTTFEKTINVL